MPAPVEATYTPAALVAAQTSFLDLLDNVGEGGRIRVRDESDTLLADIILTFPSGTVSAGGQLTLTATAPATGQAVGTASYGEVCDRNGVSYLAIPTTTGTAAQPGFIVLNSLSIIVSSPVTLVSAIIG